MKFYYILALMSWSVAESKSTRLDFFKKHHSKFRMAARYRKMHLLICHPTTCLEKCRVVYSIGKDGNAETTTFCPTHRRYRKCCQWPYWELSIYSIRYLNTNRIILLFSNNNMTIQMILAVILIVWLGLCKLEKEISKNNHKLRFLV